MSDPRLYCARYGLPRRVLLIMAGLAGFVLIAVFVPGPGFGRAAAGGFFGVCLVGMTAMWLIVQQAGRTRMSYVGRKGWTSLQVVER